MIRLLADIYRDLGVIGMIALPYPLLFGFGGWPHLFRSRRCIVDNFKLGKSAHIPIIPGSPSTRLVGPLDGQQLKYLAANALVTYPAESGSVQLVNRDAFQNSPLETHQTGNAGLEMRKPLLL